MMAVLAMINRKKHYNWNSFSSLFEWKVDLTLGESMLDKTELENMDSVQLLTVASIGSEKNGKGWSHFSSWPDAHWWRECPEDTNMHKDKSTSTGSQVMMG